MSRTFVGPYDEVERIHYETSKDTKTDPFQFTPTGILFAQSLEAGAKAKIAKMDNYLYSENEDVESDDIQPIGVYPPDIAEAYQAVRYYRGKVNEAKRVYEESLKKSEVSSTVASETSTEAHE